MTMSPTKPTEPKVPFLIQNKTHNAMRSLEDIAGNHCSIKDIVGKRELINLLGMRFREIYREEIIKSRAVN